MSGLSAEVVALLWREHANCTWVSTGDYVRWSCGIIHPGPIHMQPTTRDRHLAALVMTQVAVDITQARRDALRELPLSLVECVRSSRRSGVMIARDAGITPKHLSQMLTRHVGSLDAWVRVIHAAFPGDA